ncbi:MAG: cyclase family protein [Halieaceae bacterium]
MKATIFSSLSKLALAGLIFLPLLAMAEEADWYPSRYGATDTIGAANNLSEAGVLKAASLVTRGKTYQLGGVTGRDTPAWGHRNFNLILYPHAAEAVPPLGKNLGTSHDDYLATWLGIGTQIDGFAHYGIDHKYYNGVSAADLFAPDGTRKYATKDIPPIVTRGVLLDMVAYFKADKMLAEGVAFNESEIRGAASAQGVEIGKGDVVIFHTGWQALASADPQRFLQGEPGLDVEGAQYLAGLGVVAVGADTWGLDVLPNPNPELMFPAHSVLLAKNGVYVLENIQTEELVADGVSEFLFVLGIPRFEGAVQMVINPIAIR